MHIHRKQKSQIEVHNKNMSNRRIENNRVKNCKIFGATVSTLPESHFEVQEIFCDNTKTVGTNFMLGGEVKQVCERSKQRWGSGGLPQGNSSTTTPFRSLENAPFFESLPLKEVKDHTTDRSLSRKF